MLDYTAATEATEDIVIYLNQAKQSIIGNGIYS